MHSPFLDRLRSVLNREHRRPIDVGARHAEISIISTAHDLRPEPTEALLELAIRAVTATMEMNTETIEDRCKTADDRTWVSTWPGEHYRLLLGIARTLKPALAVEVGTFTGLGAVTLAEECERVVTFDIEPWDSFADTVLRAADFDGGHIEQRLGDLAQPDVFEANRDLLEAADLIFIDGPKGGVFEEAFMRTLLPVVDRSGALLVFDDIRVMPMIRFWRELPLPKLDLTSFGHGSGTGLAGNV